MHLTNLVKQCVEQTKWSAQTVSLERQKGRIEKRVLRVYRPNNLIQNIWPQVNKILSVRRIRTVDGKTTDKLHYYISSLKTDDPKFFQRVIRQHWEVENKLHWVKDVIMREDSTKFHNYKTLKMNALYRNLMFCCIKLKGINSIKHALELIRANPKKVINTLRT